MGMRPVKELYAMMVLILLQSNAYQDVFVVLIHRKSALLMMTRPQEVRPALLYMWRVTVILKANLNMLVILHSAN